MNTRRWIGVGVLGVLVAGAFLLVFQQVQPRAEELGNKIVPPVQTSPTPEPTTAVAQTPILMYHYIRAYADPEDKIGTNLSVSPQTFANQLRYLKDNHFSAATLNQLARHRLPPKPVILTIDDGYADAYTEAFPALKKTGMVGTFYIVTDFVGKPNYLTWEQIQEMARAGMQIESHSISHADLPTLTFEKQLKQAVDSKNILEEKLQKPVRHFCYPAGKYNEETLRAVKAAGYETATTTESGIADLSKDLLRMPRLRTLEGSDFSKLLGK